MAAPDPHDPASSPAGAPLFSAHLRSRRSRPRRVLRWAAVGLAVPGLALVALYVALNSGAARDRVLREVRERLPSSVAHFELGDDYAVDWRGRVRLGPLRVSPEPKGRVWVTAETIHIQPDYQALLRGKVRPARVRLTRVRLDPGSDRNELERLFDRFGERRAPRSSGEGSAEPSSLALEIDEAELGRAGEAGWRRIYGPFQVEAQLLRAPSGRTLEGHVTLPGEARAYFKLDQAKGAPLSIEGSAEAIPFQSLPDLISSRLPAKPVGGTAGGRFRLEAPADLATGFVIGSLTLRGLTVSNERLAPEPVGPIELTVDTRVNWIRGTRTLVLEKGNVVLGKDRATSLELLGELHLVAERPFWISLTAGPVSYPALLASVPPQLAPGPEVPRPDGPLGATARIAGELDKPEAWSVEVKLDLAGLKKAARATPIPLAGPFAYEPQESVGKPRELWVGDKNPRFVPFADLPPYVPHAVTCSEDISFFNHQGFVFLEMRDAFVEAAQHKRLRGASTLTQQLAKNLYLSRERTFSRKAKEAFVTVMLEAALPKQRLMEIYLNIIEWGPDVYGIGEAAPYYFGVDARELTVKQAVYLASIIPSPIRTHVFFEKGAINEVWEERILRVLTRMRDEGSITEAQFQEALAEPLLFRPRDTAAGEAPAAPH